MDARPLLQALHDLAGVYHEALSCAEALIGALIAGDPAGVRAAVAAQTSTLDTIASAEERRRAAERVFVDALRAERPGALHGPVNSSLLLTLLPDDEADELRAVRHDLLATLVRLQSLNRQAALLARGAQAFAARAAAVAAPQAVVYGSRGEPALARADGSRRPARWA